MAKPDQQWVARQLNSWFEGEARDLPWRSPTASPWAVLVSEFMLQQTQVDRVLPRFIEWMDRWPTAAALASDEPGEAVRAWGRLGYPRRALWLHRAAVEIAEKHGNEVPRNVETLLELTGVGPYTARAVASFAYGEWHPVVDTNTRRVLARVVHGKAAAGMPSPRDLDDMEALLPVDHALARVFNAAAMELGAVICTPRPACDRCPIAEACEWRGAGYPDNAPKRRPKQAKFDGSDRQMRGRIMAQLRAAADALPREQVLSAAAEAGVRDGEQPRRAYDSLITDGLLVEFEGRARLP